MRMRVSLPPSLPLSSLPTSSPPPIDELPRGGEPDRVPDIGEERQDPFVGREGYGARRGYPHEVCGETPVEGPGPLFPEHRHHTVPNPRVMPHAFGLELHPRAHNLRSG